MILVDNLIKERMLVEGADESQYQPSSVDLTLDDEYILYEENQIIDVKKESNTIKKKMKNSLLIQPNSFLLASTKEKISVPNNISAWVQGKSSIGRLGLIVETAGWIDSGFLGQITLELYNTNNVPIKIYPGMSICQVIFAQNVNIPDKLYDGKYFDQQGVTKSKIQEDF